MKMSMEMYQQKVNRWMKTAPKGLKTALTKGAVEIVGHTQKSRLSGPKMPRGTSGGFSGSTLQPHTNRLRGSVTKNIDVSSDRVLARIIAGTNLSYAAIHEYGGTTGRNHSVKMPERPYLRPSVEEKRSRVLDLVGDAYIDSYGK